jgi:hypothetical protein
MNTDIRLSTGFFSHPKTKLLKRKFGAESIISLQKLWIFAALNKPDGSLRGMTCDMIAVAADWDGDSQEFLSALCEIGFLEQCEEGVYHIHDWVEHNGYASSAQDRSDLARWRRLSQAHPKLFDQLKAENPDRTGISAEEYSHVVKDFLYKQNTNPGTTGLQPGTSPIIPGSNTKSKSKSNSKSITNTKEVEEPKGSLSDSGESNAPVVASDHTPLRVPVQEIVDLWNTKIEEHRSGMPKITRINQGSIRERTLRARWKEFPEMAIWDDCFTKAATSPFMGGQNKRGWTANFDWVIKPNNFLKVLEGNYNQDAGGKYKTGDSFDEIQEAFAKIRRELHAE